MGCPCFAAEGLQGWLLEEGFVPCQVQLVPAGSTMDPPQGTGEQQREAVGSPSPCTTWCGEMVAELGMNE